MSNYKQEVASGESWQRAKEIRVLNPINEFPTIYFDEEQVIQLDTGETIKSARDPSSTIKETLTFDNATTEFPLINPQTGERIPDATSTYQELQVLMHSLYIYMAKRRDGGPQPYPSWTWDYNLEDWFAPVEKPTDGTTEYTYGWNEIEGRWDNVEMFDAPPNDEYEYIWEADTQSWTRWRLK